MLLDDLAADGIPDTALFAPGGTVAAIQVAESARVSSLAIVRTSDRACAD